MFKVIYLYRYCFVFKDYLLNFLLDVMLGLVGRVCCDLCFKEFIGWLERKFEYLICIIYKNSKWSIYFV